MIRYMLTAMLLVFASPYSVSAAWHEASSDHFVIYADEKPEQLREFALRLERYHSAMSFQMGLDIPKPSPSNRVTVYVVRNEKDVRKLYGEGANRFLGGFYTPRAGGSLAIIPDIAKGSVDISESERVLFHEYAHHFLLGSSAIGFPRWLSEGFAEFYSTTRFERDGHVGLGLPATHRAGELQFAVDVPVAMLLDTQAYLARKSKGYDEFYGKSWAMFHFLRFTESRQGQLKKYFALLAEGKSDIDAAIGAFGDLKVLEKDLDRYLNQRKMYYYKIPPDKLTVSPINVRALDAGHAAMMPLLIQSKRGVDQDQAKALVPQVRAVAAKFPQSAAVLAALAEAEFDSGNDEAAIEAANRATIIDPANVNALLQKAYAMARLAENGKLAGNKPWSQVRSQFVKVNKVENDHPIPLMRYYTTYGEDGAEPPKLAVQGLERALELAPFDPGLRLMVAGQQITDGRKEAAIATLQPLAYDPHDSGLASVAREMIDRAKSGEEASAAEETAIAEATEKAEPE